MKLNFYLILHTKVNSKWIRDPDMRERKYNGAKTFFSKIASEKTEHTDAKIKEI